MADRLLTVTEVAAQLQVSEGWVYKHSTGKRHPILPTARMGGALRFRQEAVDAFIREQERAA